MIPKLEVISFKAVLSGCLFICSILLSYSSHAQHGYTQGFIIKQSGDTVKGFIKQRNSKKLSFTCEFKETKSAKSKEYTPAEISGFRFESGKYFITKAYKTENDSKLVFMEYLIKGKANMFYFRDTQGDHYMLEKEGDKMIELTEEQKYVQKQGYGTVKVPLKYTGKLLAELSECNDIRPVILESKLNNNSLTQVAKQYHDCVCTTESCIIYEKKKPKTLISYTVTAGYSLIRYNFGDELTTNFRPGIQVGAEVDFKRFLFSDEKFSFSTGVFLERDFSFTLSMYNKNDFNGKDVTYKGEHYTIDNEKTFLTVTKLNVALNVTALKIPILFKYAYVHNKFSLEGGLGISNRFILSKNSEFSFDSFDRQYGKTFRSYYVGPAVSLKTSFGVFNQKAISFSIMGDYVTDPKSINQFLRLNTTQLTFKVGYTL